MVEALIVISFLIIGLFGLMYFKELYVKKFMVQRLARAALFAHSLTGCQGDNAAAWLGRDLGPFTAGGGTPEAVSASDPDTPNSYANPGGGEKSQANGVVSPQGNLGKGTVTDDGKGILNQMVSMDLSGLARFGTDPARLRPGERGSGFQGTVSSRSHISCAEKVTDEGFGDMFDKVKNLMRDAIPPLEFL
jgi:hypothetical protein